MHQLNGVNIQIILPLGTNLEERRMISSLCVTCCRGSETMIHLICTCRSTRTCTYKLESNLRLKFPSIQLENLFGVLNSFPIIYETRGFRFFRLDPILVISHILKNILIGIFKKQHPQYSIASYNRKLDQGFSKKRCYISINKHPKVVYETYR